MVEVTPTRPMIWTRQCMNRLTQVLFCNSVVAAVVTRWIWEVLSGTI